MKSKKQLTADSLQLTVRKGFSALILILIVAIVGVAAVLAFGVLNVGNIKKSQPSQVTETSTDPVVQELGVLGTSDKVSDIAKDLDNTKLNDLDQDIGQIDKDTSSL